MTVNQSSNNWNVVTGGPSAGKTTTLEIIETRGFKIVPEAARTIIDEGIAHGLTVEQIREDEKSFQEVVINKKIEIESSLDPKETIFFDRGMHDSTAYYEASGFSLDDWVIRAINKATYKKVFLLEPISEYKTDYARTESPAIVNKINILLFNAYSQAGLEPIRIPNMPPVDRADLILKYSTTLKG